MSETIDFVWAHAVRPHKIMESLERGVAKLRLSQKQFGFI
jgi:hypothetical protein